MLNEYLTILVLQIIYRVVGGGSANLVVYHAIRRRGVYKTHFCPRIVSPTHTHMLRGGLDGGRRE